ncbi:class I SAM-dependent methyltransferase [bacterium BMS3Abin03]|nr:class I SAM-dependent methyltransferase [bacterium BMS3Abin03]
MSENKKHWYDGLFYDKLIAPNQDRLFTLIKKLIEPQSKLIDVGCGTGRFSFTVSDKCESVLGIDLSERNINRANLLLLKNPQSNLSFKHTSVNELISNGEQHFDYAVLTYVIHEVNPEERILLLKEISKIADKIIIGDYLVPQPKGFWKLLNEAVEFAAGSEHYRNYKNFVSDGGITGIAGTAGLKIAKEIKNRPQTSHLVILSANK